MRMSTIRRFVAISVSIVLAALSVVPASAVAQSGDRGLVELQILNVSDFHGQLDPLSVSGVSVGGAAALSAYWQADRQANPNTLLLTAGDAVGASPPLSSFFDDEPTIRFMNYAGFTADTFGNHNFDGGLAHL
jgi:5'-nucleotidase